MAESTKLFNPFLDDPSDSDNDSDGKTIEDVFRLVKSQNRRFNKWDKDFAGQKTLIEEVAKHLNTIDSTQSVAIEQSTKALLKSSENEISIEILNQKLLKSCLVFAGIPFCRDEKVHDIITAICALLGVKLTVIDFSICYRIGHQMRANSKGVLMPPTIMVEFSREEIKASILTAIKNSKKSLSSSDIGFLDQPPSRIYINERLTPYNHRILREALNLKAKNQLKFVWTNGGFVHGRVDFSSPILQFKSVGEIYEILGICHPSVNPVDASGGIERSVSSMSVDGVVNQSDLPTFVDPAFSTNSIINTKRKLREFGSSQPTKIKKVSPLSVRRGRGRPRKRRKSAGDITNAGLIHDAATPPRDHPS